MADQNEQSFGRRDVLRQAGSLTVAATAASGLASARDSSVDPGTELRSIDAVGALTETLAARGLVSEPTPDALALSGDLSESDAGTREVTAPDGRYLVSVTPLADGTLRVFHRVDSEETYAVVDRPDSTRRINPDGETTEITSSGCTNYCSGDYECGTSNIILYLKLYRTTDALGDCYVYDTKCECEYGFT